MRDGDDGTVRQFAGSSPAESISKIVHAKQQTLSRFKRLEMSRTKIIIDKELLLSCLSNQDNQGYLNHSILFTKIADEYNKQIKSGSPIKGGVVRLRLLEYGVEFNTLKTKKGRKGEGLVRSRANQSDQVTEQKTVPNTVKKNKNMAVQAMKELCDRNNAQKYYKLVEKTGRNSMKAAIRFQCIQCCGFQVHEIRKCGAIDCSLWLFRN